MQQYPTVEVTGFFDLDAGWFDQDRVNRQTLGNLENNMGFRRTRLAATGNVAEDIRYILEFDFAESQARFVDVWMQFDDVGEFANLRVGRFRQPFGMGTLTGIREIPFLERALPFFGFAPFRQTGVMAFNQADNERLTWAVAGYGYSTDAFGNLFGDSGGWGMASRLTVLPIYEDDGRRLLHLGADYSFNDPARDTERFASPPEFFASQNTATGARSLLHLPLTAVPPFVDTGPIPAENTNLFNVEAAAALGRLYLQSEARWAVTDRIGQSSVTFPGLYAHARYVLTGEKLPYLKESGVFGRIVPDEPVRLGRGGGIGAWEIGMRWSHLDLNGPGLQGPGRRLNDLTLGLNWYLNRFVKFQFNYIHAFLDDPVQGDSDVNLFAIRGHLGF